LKTNYKTLKIHVFDCVLHSIEILKEMRFKTTKHISEQNLREFLSRQSIDNYDMYVQKKLLLKIRQFFKISGRRHNKYFQRTFPSFMLKSKVRAIPVTGRGGL
jgi:hypothetical protein